MFWTSIFASGLPPPPAPASSVPPPHVDHGQTSHDSRHVAGRSISPASPHAAATAMAPDRSLLGAHAAVHNPVLAAVQLCDINLDHALLGDRLNDATYDLQRPDNTTPEAIKLINSCPAHTRPSPTTTSLAATGGHLADKACSRKPPESSRIRGAQLHLHARAGTANGMEPSSTTRSAPCGQPSPFQLDFTLTHTTTTGNLNHTVDSFFNEAFDRKTKRQAHKSATGVRMHLFQPSNPPTHRRHNSAAKHAPKGTLDHRHQEPHPAAWTLRGDAHGWRGPLLMSRYTRDSGHSSTSWYHNGWTPSHEKQLFGLEQAVYTRKCKRARRQTQLLGRW